MRSTHSKRFFGNVSLWFAQGLIAFLRFSFRVWEMFASEKNRVRLRELRKNMDALEQERDAAIGKLQTGRYMEGIEAVHALSARHGSPADRERDRVVLERLRSLHQESGDLKAIREQAGSDHSVAVEGYQKYIREHPDSGLAYSFLGSVLMKAGALEDSLAAYQEALRLAERPSVAEAMAHLNIGQVLHQKGEFEAAAARYRLVLDDHSLNLSGMYCLAHFYLGNALQELGDRAGARSAWKTAAKLDTTGTISKSVRQQLKTYSL